MPIKTQNGLPAKGILENENIFVMDENRAIHQDIRPLQICIFEFNASEAGYGAAGIKGIIQYTIAGRCYLYENEQPSFPEYAYEPFEPILPYLRWAEGETL